MEVVEVSEICRKARPLTASPNHSTLKALAFGNSYSIYIMHNGTCLLELNKNETLFNLSSLRLLVY